MPEKRIKLLLLYVLIASVIIGALSGIIIILRAEWSWIEIRIILTTVVLAISSLCGLASDVARTPKSAPVLPITGLGLTAMTAGLFLYGIWASVSEETFWKMTISATFLTFATVQVCLLSIARLASRFRWVFVFAFQVAYGLAFYLIYMIFAEVDSADAVRLAGVISIVDAAFSLVIPILHRISRADSKGEAIVTPLGERNMAAIDAEIATLQKRIVQLKKLREEIEHPS